MLDDPVYNLAEYLKVSKKSRSRFYKEIVLGIAVDHYRSGNRIHVRHSAHLRHVEKAERLEREAAAAARARANLQAEARAEA